MADKNVTAEELAEQLRAVSVAEFFEKNRHLLGYENPTKALITIVKELVDNSLDACQDANILPDIKISVKEVSPDRFRIRIEDNGPGIVEEKLALAFGKLLYGSKFHRLRQSVSWDERILIKENNIIKSIEIGKFVDSFLGKKYEEKDISSLNIETVAFDPETYKLTWKSIANVIRHSAEEPLYKIKLESGREVKVTSSHSVFVLDTENLKVKSVETDKIKVGDYVLTAKQIPDTNAISRLNIFDFIPYSTLKKHWWYVYDLEKEIFTYLRTISKKYIKNRKTYYSVCKGKEKFKIRSDYLSFCEKRGMLPARVISLLLLHKKFNLKKCKIKTYEVGGKTYEFPINFPISKDFVRFVGFWVAEGHLGTRSVVFDFGIHEKKYIEEIKRISKKLFLREVEELPDFEKNRMRLKISSTVLYNLFRHLGIKTGTKNKEIPFFVYNIRHELKSEFLRALYSGDGSFWNGNRKSLNYTTVSRNLASDILYLMGMKNVLATISTEKNKGLGKIASNIFRIMVYGNELNKLWYNIKYRRQSWARLEGLPSILIKKLGRFNDLPERISRENALSYLRFKETRTNENYFNILNFISSGTYLPNNKLMNTQFYVSRLEKSGLLKESERSYFITQEGKNFISKIEKLKKLIFSDFNFLKVKKIEKINYRKRYVYDLSIPKCENFVAGLGGLICHNSRGTQGLGASGGILYSQLTTGKPVKLVSSTGKEIHEIELMIDVNKNEPKIISHKEEKNPSKWHGMKIEVEAEGRYIEGKQSVLEYIKQTAMSNPYAKITYDGPNGKVEFERTVKELPPLPKEIKPHPYGVELGLLRRMLTMSNSKNLIGFLTSDFSRVGRNSALQICRLAKLEGNRKPHDLNHEEAGRLHKAMQMVKLIGPPTDCLSPLREKLLEEGLKKETKAEYVVAVTRPPSVYRGNPFLVEVCMGFGGELPQNQTAQLFRFANKVPLMYHASDCATTEATVETDFRRYGFSQSSGQLPEGQLAILIHFASVWVPYTSEGKQAIASYPEIIKEMKLALQEAGRKLATYVRHKNREREKMLRQGLFEKYVPEISAALSEISESQRNIIESALRKILSKDKIIETTEEKQEGEIENEENEYRPEE